VRKSCLTLQATDERGAKALRIYIEPELTGYEDLQEGNSHPPPPPESAKTKKGWNAVLKIVGLAEDDSILTTPIMTGHPKPSIGLHFRMITLNT
jgi:hypothetical protein